MILDLDHPVIWHVCFHPGASWWGKYRHVSLAGYHDDTWINLDLGRKGVQVAVIHRHEAVKEYLQTLLNNYLVVRVGVVGHRGRSFGRPMTCVALVKHVLGVRSGTLRPDALLKEILRDFDAEILNEPSAATPH